MTKYLVEYECAHWCGGESHVVVNADSEEEAVLKADTHMAEDMQELFSAEYEDEESENLSEECPYTVNSIQEFNSDHEYWKFYKDPTQQQFFPEIFSA